MTIEDLQEELSSAEGGSKIGNLLKKVTAKKEGGTAVGNLIRGKVGALGSKKTPQGNFVTEVPETPSGDKKGLSTWAWVGIGAGVLALGGIIYVATKK